MASAIGAPVRARHQAPSLRHVAPPRSPLSLERTKLIIYAHRGDTTKHLENTRAAFDAALERGFRAFELDLLRTKDHRVVVFHDFWLHRLFRRRKRVSAITVPDFRRIFPDLLLFDEFVERYGKEKIIINLEVKDSVATLNAIEPALAGIRAPVISSFKPEIVHAAAAMGLEAGYLFHTKKAFLRRHKEMKTRRLHLSSRMLRDRLASDLYGGYDVHTYTVNDPSEALALSRLGFVRGIFTDNPDLLKIPGLSPPRGKSTTTTRRIEKPRRSGPLGKKVRSGSKGGLPPRKKPSRPPAKGD